MTPFLRVGTDGSAHLRKGADKTTPCGWAWVDEHGRYAYGTRRDGTNQVAELLAIHHALLDHPDIPVEIEYDSAYAKGCIVDWYPSWVAKNKLGEKKNVAVIERAHRTLAERSHPVRWTKVKGHRARTEHPLNTVADLLADRASRKAFDEHSSIHRGRLDIDQVVTGGKLPVDV